MKNTTKRKTREEVKMEETWDLSALFSSRKEWEMELEAIKNDVKEVVACKGTLHTGANTLLHALQVLEAFQKRMVLVSTYAFLQTSTDGSNDSNQAGSAKVSAVFSEVSASISFFEPEILMISKETIQQWVEEEKALEPYRKMLEDIMEKKPYTLAPELEETLAALGEVHDAPFMIYERSKTSDMVFDSIIDDEGNHLPMSEALYEDRYEMSSNTTIRRNAYQSYVQTLHAYKHTYAALYATEVSKQVSLAKIRGFDSVTDMLLHPQQVTKEMYHQQLDIIQAELAPHMRKLMALKQKEYKLDSIAFCDLKAPLDPNYQPETTFSEAKEMIVNALQVLGPEYSAIMEQAFTDRWIDYTDNIGKQSGAFCASPYGAHPYILLTWTNMMRGTFTLAHELGHAGHFYLANKYQNINNTNVSTYFVEAPSTLNELLLAHYLLENTNNQRMRRFTIHTLLDSYYHNFITHLLEGEFQRRIYHLAEAGTPLTANVLCEQKLEVIKGFWGDVVDIDEDAGLTWMRQPHYYMGLYPYTYSAGLTVATAVSQKIIEEGQPAVDRWIDVLKAGGSLKPLELTKKADVDMSNPETIKTAVDYVGSLVQQLEEAH